MPWRQGIEFAVPVKTADGDEETTRFIFVGPAAALQDATGIAVD